MYILVYGTLKEKFSNHYLINLKALGTFMLPNHTMYDLGAFPALVYNEHALHPITCELFKIKPSMIEFLDRLEGYTGDDIESLYVRKQVKIRYKGDDIEAHVYVMRPTCNMLTGKRILLEGNWTKGRLTGFG